ncbi:Ldh family oxidoreductase [Pusillimonas sp. ANT_WB101]|uniref:Ldh family oxidoreductase n=1 Tax=Pusillimonas sp. ANT_WB101 TaxID=2597356 RepID=UPI0011F09B77|nr:Ldh family oxidoreductase [Pusillimonas sp. ANT_WB101]KAA0890816.1 Ldh family oxidoreductase [Pusillimonas sp. ANT_WB101]
MRVCKARLQNLATRLLEDHGAPSEIAGLQAAILIEAELRDLPSHGLMRLPRLLERINNGMADPAASGLHFWRGSSLLEVDGQRALGPVAMMSALETMLPRLQATGITLAAIRNANHIGMLAYYAEQAAARNAISIVLSTSEALVHPFGGTRAMLGTNPIAIGIPTSDQPFVLDLATSLVSMGKVHSHALRGEPLSNGWAVDSSGHPTLNAEAAKHGAIAPFGEAKGYGLGLAVELLVAALAGSQLAPEIHGTLDATEPANKGDLLILIDPGASNGVAARLSNYLNAIRASRPLYPGRPVAVPGDGTRKRREAALRDGINIPTTLLDELQRLDDKQERI